MKERFDSPLDRWTETPDGLHPTRLVKKLETQQDIDALFNFQNIDKKNGRGCMVMHATGDSNEFISSFFVTIAYENPNVHFHTVGVNANGCVLWPEEPVYTDNGVHHLLVSHHHLLTCTHTLSLPPLGSGFKLACPPRHTRGHLMGAKVFN